MHQDETGAAADLSPARRPPSAPLTRLWWRGVHHLVARPWLFLLELVGAPMEKADRFRDLTAELAWPGPMTAEEARASIATLLDAAHEMAELVALDAEAPLEQRRDMRQAGRLLDDVQLAIATGRIAAAITALEPALADLRATLAAVEVA